MKQVFKIHPAIGIARVGKSSNGYFIGAESSEGEPFEMNESGITSFLGYKDSHYQIRKQGVRFRIFEYQQDETTGKETYIGELKPENGTVKWKISLGNGKAAGPEMTFTVTDQGQRVVIPDVTKKRNSSIISNREKLHPIASIDNISGINQSFVSLDSQIMGKSINLGSAGSDYAGNLVVLGGTGEAGCWQEPELDIQDFLNNDYWYDTTADGPVDATIELTNGTILEATGAWVIVGPPDFAPAIHPIVSLWDLMSDTLVRAGKIEADEIVSYEKHIKPVLEKAANYRWIHNSALWGRISKQLIEKDLSDRSEENRPLREQISKAIQNIPLTDFKLTLTQIGYFKKWEAGEFEISTPITETENQEPYKINHASLSRAIGSGLFPGIEMGFMATNAEIFDEPFRFARTPFIDIHGQTTSLTPGSVVQRMACPWQADFMECAGNWWPAQRPDLSKYKPDGTPGNILWARGVVQDNGTGSVDSHHAMVKNYSDLAVIEEINIGGKKLFVETGRNPELPE